MINQVFTTPLTSAPRPSTQQTDRVGDIRWEFDLSNKAWKCYKYVQLLADEGSADVNIAANGDAVCYDDYSAHTVTPDITDIEGKMPAGIIVNFANWDGDVSANYGKRMWIQIKGPATVSGTVKSSAAAGDRIDMTSSGVTDLFFTLHAPTHTAGNDHIPCGVLINAGTKEVYLDCPF